MRKRVNGEDLSMRPFENNDQRTLEAIERLERETMERSPPVAAFMGQFVTKCGSQRLAAKRLGVSESFISKALRGEVRVSKDLAQRLDRALRAKGRVTAAATAEAQSRLSSRTLAASMIAALRPLSPGRRAETEQAIQAILDRCWNESEPLPPTLTSVAVGTRKTTPSTKGRRAPKADPHQDGQ